MAHNEQNIPAGWIKPHSWPENKTHGFFTTQKGSVLVGTLHDYAYDVLLSELAYRIDFLNKEIAALRHENSKLFAEAQTAKVEERKVRFCWEQDAKRLAWWNDTFQSFSRAKVLEIVSANVVSTP